ATFLVYTLTRRRGEVSSADPTERADHPAPEAEPGGSIAKGLALLAGATVGAAICSEILVDSSDSVMRQLGLSEFFVGVIVVAIIGNAAEQFIAVRSAWRNHLDATLTITAG